MALKKPLVLVAGEIEGITAGDAIDIQHGGTGGTTVAEAKTALGLTPGVDIQAFDADISALAALATTGVVVRTGAGTATTRSIAGTSTRVTVTNGDGVAGNPTVDLATLANGGSGTFQKLTTDAYGRVSATTPVLTTDLRTLVDSVYVTKDANSALASGVTVSYNPATTTFGSNTLVPQSYVDARIEGMIPKPACRFLIDTNVSLAAPGAGPFDTVTPAPGDRIFLNAQTTGSQNGPYIYNGAAAALTRPLDFDTNADATPGSTFFISEGTLYGNNNYTLITDGPIVLGTTSLTFTQTNGLGQIVAGNGMTKTGNTLDVGTASATRIVVNADNIDLATSGVVAGTYTKFTVDSYGRATVGATATPADIGAQSVSAILTSLSAVATNGSLVKTAAGVVVTRTMVQPASGFSITNADMVAGNATFTLTGDLAGLESLATTGFGVRSATDTWLTRAITGTAGRVAVTNGDGVAGAPVLDLVVSGVTAGTYNSVTTDIYGRITAASNVASSSENSSSILTNANGTTISICQAVYSDAAGVKLSRADAAATRRAIGLVGTTSIANSATGPIVTSGIFTASTAQWDAVTGQTGGLTPNTDYYASATTAGGLTTTAPFVTGQWVQPIGIALNSTKMKVEMTRSVKV